MLSANYLRICLLFAAVLSGCGRIGFDKITEDPILSVDPFAPFTAVGPVAELNSNLDDDDPTLTADLLEL